eukprot:Platyproteum_vivax@DN1801_c0_g1_i1.p1
MMLTCVNNQVGNVHDNQIEKQGKNGAAPGLKRSHTRKALGDIGNCVKQDHATITRGSKGAGAPPKSNAPAKSEAKERAERDAELSAVDVPFRFDAVYVAPYAEQISSYMRQTEGLFIAPPGFLTSQKDITARMRSILVDWMAEVHHRFKLNQETLFLAVNYLDRFLAQKPISRNRLQLAGVTALWVASKVEDVFQPEMRDFEFVTDKACTRKEMLELETEMLDVLDFQLMVPTACYFQQRYLQVAGVQPKTFVAYMAAFFLECTLGDVQFSAFKPSLLAAASVYLAKKACKMAPHWTADMDVHTGYSQQNDIRTPAKALCSVVNDLQKSPFQAVRIKYSSERYREVAREVLPGPVPSSSTTGRARK